MTVGDPPPEQNDPSRGPRSVSSYTYSFAASLLPSTADPPHVWDTTSPGASRISPASPGSSGSTSHRVTRRGAAPAPTSVHTSCATSPAADAASLVPVSARPSGDVARTSRSARTAPAPSSALTRYAGFSGGIGNTGSAPW